MVDGARSATPADLDAVVTLAREAINELSELRGGTIWRLRDARREPVDAGIGDLLDGGDAGVVVGTFEEVVVGYGISRLETLANGDRLAVVDDLYVHPEARGVGVGEAMMDLLVARALDAGAIGIDSLALPGDRDTKNFFETFGLKARALVVHKPLGER